MRFGGPLSVILRGMKCWIFLASLIVVVGCGLSEAEVREGAGDAAVSAKRFLEGASQSAKDAFNRAAEKGKELKTTAEEKLDDALLRGKVIAGFNLVKGLDASGITVDARDGTVTLTGTVPTELDRMKATGVAYGVTGSMDRVVSKLEVRKG